MVSKLFADSNFFISLTNTDDSTHLPAMEIFKSIGGFEELSITNFIFSEVITVVSQKVGKSEAMELGEDIKKKVSIIYLDEDIMNLAWSVFKSDKSKNLSFTDATSLAIIKLMGFKKFLTFDKKDFRKYQSTLDFKIIC
ncbi:MAG: type II toxin-antitoxin system VapC family toxin [Candidatus Dojkabacteria bacterium]